MSEVRFTKWPVLPPSPPPPLGGSGVVTLYAKDDGRFYSKAEDGIERGPFDTSLPAPNGSAGSPSIAFQNDLTSGLYFQSPAPGVSEIGLSVKGFPLFLARNSGTNPQLRLVRNATLGVTVPPLTFIDASTTGMFLPEIAGIQGPALGFTVNGAEALRITSGSDNKIRSQKTFLAPNGGSAANAYGFVSDPGTGMFKPGTGVGFATGNFLRMSIQDDGVYPSVHIKAPNGGPFGPASPPYSFSGSTDSGLYLASSFPSTPSVGISANANTIAAFQSDGPSTSRIKLLNGNISATAPSVESNALYSNNVPKAWGVINITAGVPTITAGFNLDSVSVVGLVGIRIDLRNPMLGSTYAVVLTGVGTDGTWIVTGGTNSTFFQVGVFVGGVVQPIAGMGRIFSFVVFGPQA